LAAAPADQSAVHGPSPAPAGGLPRRTSGHRCPGHLAARPAAAGLNSTGPQEKSGDSRERRGFVGNVVLRRLWMPDAHLIRAQIAPALSLLRLPRLSTERER